MKIQIRGMKQQLLKRLCKNAVERFSKVLYDTREVNS